MARPSSSVLSFLYPCLHQSPLRYPGCLNTLISTQYSRRHIATEALREGQESESLPDESSHLNPQPSDYGRNFFADKATIEVSAGSGGHGCVSFLREKFLDNGPANGGNGGTGGSIYIQAIPHEKSLHKLARRRVVKAGRGKNGQGKNKGGKRGDDVLIQVPIGTVIREISRHDPVAEEEDSKMLLKGESEEEEDSENVRGTWRKDKWILYPAATPSEYSRMAFPPLPGPRRPALASAQPPSPIYLDLSRPMEKPMLLAAGAVGGYGNPHFVSGTMTRPKMATRGEEGMTISLKLELKLLADVGFVGMPNAGKSTLLRALSKSKARVGSWAFTTLEPNIGTMVLDDHRGRPQIQASKNNGEPRTHVTVADIPGLIKDAHLDRGLGLGFLRHVERAQVLAFVVDLSNGDAIESLETLWRELREFEKLRDMETNLLTETHSVQWSPFRAKTVSPVAYDENVDTVVLGPRQSRELPELDMAPISTKPWFVVATKADIQDTQENFVRLQAYLDALAQGSVKHPSGNDNAWKGKLAAIPVSAINAEGVERIPEWTVGLLND